MVEEINIDKEQPKIKKRAITDKEKEMLNTTIENSEAESKRLAFKIKHANMMLEEGLDVNYEEQKAKITTEKAEMEAKIKFNDKVIEQYSDILKSGEVSEADVNEEA